MLSENAVIPSAVMAKFKAARGKSKPAAPSAGLPCVILIIVAMGLVMLFMYIVLRNANG
jgi:hypothetical protein